MIYFEQQLLRQKLSAFRKNRKPIGFVPTMGALHKGHLSLVQQALTENDVVVVSIFVNPTQFDNAADLKKYPRTLDADARLLQSLNANVLIYAPQATDLYGLTIKSKSYRFGGLEHAMEGKFRHGHFDGVGTVLNLLFKAVQPTKAYFGEKDFQQLQIVKKLVEIENLPVQIMGCPILREPHGLAMSSRNKRLSKEYFEESVVIFKTLTWVQQNFRTKSIAEIRQTVDTVFTEHKLLELEYFEIANIKNLKTAHRKRSTNTYRAFIAAYAGKVRLIDNIALPKSK